MEKEKLIAIPYLRFSSGRQAQGSSYERQHGMIAEWLQRHPQYVLSTMRFEDMGISGWSGAHLENGFGKLLEAINMGHIPTGSVVLCEAWDRIGRLEPLQMIGILSNILKAGVNIITLDDGTEYTRESANGPHLFLLAAKVQQANLFSENLSRRISESWESRRKKADNGEAIKKRLPVWLAKNNQIREEIAPIIVEAFELYAAGWGERRIRRRIKERCISEDGTILYPELHKVSPAGVQSWWDMKTAIGYWNDIPGVHPAVISMELWIRVQQERKSRYTGPKKSAPSKHPLTGLVICGNCGKNYRMKNDKRKTPVMTCGHRGRLGADACTNGKAIPVDVLEAVMMFTCLDYIKRAVISEHPSLNVKKLAEIEFRLGEVHKQLKSLADTIAITGAIDELVNKAKDLNEEKTALEYERTLLSC
ncbi:recombinase family protein [Azotobacter chroococcum]|uniref:Phage recombinase n=1 Tax=Azotobacter chroococcum NCIMB 8003 TaxID=1328314 RepID=A0A0C4WSP0_9GAMM|nr:recombinase family protein [Azotobacter chroococcum]AJE22610.1 Phage recombinase [Azotobacter chroococcum NCIMB 8003]